MFIDPAEKFPEHTCFCWCQGWAEVLIRRPTGNISWMLWLENLPSLPASIPLSDISSLFFPDFQNAQPDLFKKYEHSHKRIDSDSLGEQEYDVSISLKLVNAMDLIFLNKFFSTYK